ncbi:MAG: TAXI family TRAP transporter solute-binding subunit [Phycisphaerae bacterium]|nr:TAXI family TRAP transporter solute-binding subunit [Phycisphaerae bacterium]
MQNRLNVLGALILSMGVIMAGCSKKSDQGSQSNGSRQFLSLGTAPPGGAFFVVGSAIAEVVQAHTENTGWQITAEATKGTQENIHRLDKSEIDFALANAAITFFAVRGQGKWDKQYPIQSVMTLAPNVALFVTPANSGIKTMADLKGRRVVIGPAGAGFEYFVGPILEAHGLSYEDIQPLNDTQAGAVALLADGSADAAFLGGVVPTASITQACASQDIRFIQFDEAAKDHLISEYPFFEPKTIPANTYKGQTATFHGLNVGSMILVTGSSVPEATVYEFTKTLYEHAAEVVEKHPAGSAINPTNAVRDTGTAFHPGAIRYYKEIGIWKKD